MVQQLPIEFKAIFPYANDISNALDMPQSEGKMFQGSMHESLLLALQQLPPIKYRHSNTSSNLSIYLPNDSVNLREACLPVAYAGGEIGCEKMGAYLKIASHFAVHALYIGMSQNGHYRQIPHP